jgi:hypothetical protein
VAVTGEILDTPVERVLVNVQPLYEPPSRARPEGEGDGRRAEGAVVDPVGPASPESAPEAPAQPSVDPATKAPDGAKPPPGHPARLTETQAVAVADRPQVERLASFLRPRLSFLVSCEKLVVPHLWPHITGSALVTQAEAAMFEGFDPQGLFKNVAGLNPVRLRQAMAYAVQVAHDKGHSPDNPAKVELLYRGAARPLRPLP